MDFFKKLLVMVIFLLLMVMGLSAKVAGDETLFAPSPVEKIIKALKLADVKKEDVFYDLGCGDGRAPIIASLLYGCNSVGIELDKDVAALATENVKLNKVEDLVKIYQDDILSADFSKATVIYLYLMPELSEKIKGRLLTIRPRSRIIAFDKPIPGWIPDRQIENIYVYVIKERWWND